MTPRAAQSAAMSWPDANPQFRRWPAPAIGDATAKIRAWHDFDVRPPPISAARRRAEAEWAKLIGKFSE